MQQQSIIQIKCPFDGTILSVKNMPGIETKNVTCPICKNSYPFTEFKRVVPGAPKPQAPGAGMPQGGGAQQHEGHTQYGPAGGFGGGGEGHTQYGPGAGGYSAGGATQVFDPSMKKGPGKLTVLETGQQFILSPGRNIVGRRASQSSANIQIETGGRRQMSREHLIINVIVMGNGAYQAHASLFKERVNETTINGQPLAFGDTIILNEGSTIKLPDATLRYSL